MAIKFIKIKINLLDIFIINDIKGNMKNLQ